MEYQIIRSMDDEKLARKVNAAIAEGWVPQGGVAIGCMGPSGDIYYLQAMIKTA